MTFERKVAAQYLSLLLLGNGAAELGDGRRILTVGFQKAPDHPVDDLVIRAALADETAPSLELALAVRRSPKLTRRDPKSQALIREFVQALIQARPAPPEQRLGLVVSGAVPAAQQLKLLADEASCQEGPAEFFGLIHTPGRFDAKARKRLDHMEALVARALRELEIEADEPLVRQRAWELLSILTVSMPRIESPDETDWPRVANDLKACVVNSELGTATQLRDRLLVLAGEYSRKAAEVGLNTLRRDAHALLDAERTRRNRTAWQRLTHLHEEAFKSVRYEMASSRGVRKLRLDRTEAANELSRTVEDAVAVVVTGESGVGKSALTLQCFAEGGGTEPSDRQALCVNLRHLPSLTLEFETHLGAPLSTVLEEMSAPSRILVIDAADAIAEGKRDALRHIAEAANQSGVRVVAVTSDTNKKQVVDTLHDCIGPSVGQYALGPLTDAELEQVLGEFPELSRLGSNPRSREILRRLVVADLLVRASVSESPLTDADAMNLIWEGLVCRPDVPARGSPSSRASALLRLAELELMGGDKLAVVGALDSAAIASLCTDQVLRGGPQDRGDVPEFAHEELRRYAVARLLLSDEEPASRLVQAGAPRWALSAAQLACQAWLAHRVTAEGPLRNSLASLQASFDALVKADFGARWGDVPGEALLSLPDFAELLSDGWRHLRADDDAGLKRLVRLVDQRLRDDNYVVKIAAVDPMIALLLEEPDSWRIGTYTERLMRAWLRAHVVSATPAGHSLRLLLQAQLVADCRVPVQHPDLGEPLPRRVPAIHEATDQVVLELLALLGPDLGEEGEEILRRVAQEAPGWIAPAVEEPFAGHALAQYMPGLLADLTEAYYVDDRPRDPHGVLEQGIRPHRARRAALWGDPHAAWQCGPFFALFRSDFRNGVAVVNRMLNHAACVRSRSLAHADREGHASRSSDVLGSYWTRLGITGSSRRYIGDESVWLWYRGMGVGPYPCMSALQALERSCDQLIEEHGVPVENLVALLLRDCENLAMVSLIVGLLVRHLDDDRGLLDPFLLEPIVWHLEFNRVVHESAGILGASSEGLVHPERRGWSLRDAAFVTAVRAEGDRVAELRDLGGRLVENAKRWLASTKEDPPSQGNAGLRSLADLRAIRGWASILNPDNITVREEEGGVTISSGPPDSVLQDLEEHAENHKRGEEGTRLFLRYQRGPSKGIPKVPGADELEEDLATARKLLEVPPSSGVQRPWETVAMIAGAVIEAHVLRGDRISHDAVVFAGETLLRAGEEARSPRPYEFEGTLYEPAADRSAARSLPLLLLPEAAFIRTAIGRGSEASAYRRTVGAISKLADAVADETRLHLTRGLDHVWSAPCTGRCRCRHHKVAWRTVLQTMRGLVLGDWNPLTGRRVVRSLRRPSARSFARIEGAAVYLPRLDAAIRALAPASVAKNCVSRRAHRLLLAALDAQRRCLLSHPDWDSRDFHTLVSARALLTLAEHGDDSAIFKHIDAYADSSSLISKFLGALSAVAEETPERAAAAKRLWPRIVRHVLALNDSEHTPFGGDFYGDLAVAALLPRATGDWAYFHREVQGKPTIWWDPRCLRAEVEEWLTVAKGRRRCVDRLICFLEVLTTEEQVRTGLGWISEVVLDDPEVAADSLLLEPWLIGSRQVATVAGRSMCWQKIVDALVVAGAVQLAPYSE